MINTRKSKTNKIKKICFRCALFIIISLIVLVSYNKIIDSRILVGNSYLYLHGVNLPWYDWSCDFGGNASTHWCESARVSNPEVKGNLSYEFQELEKNNIHFVRWFTFPGSAPQIIRDCNETPIELNPEIYKDFDAALELAEKYDLYYVFVIFSGQDQIPQSWITDGTKQEQVADVLRPLFRRYKDNPRILTWEIVNEPDIYKNFSANDTGAFVRQIAKAIHEESNAYSTVGLFRKGSLRLSTDWDLDYYDLHWVSEVYNSSIFGNFTYDEFKELYGLDGPLVIGEFYGGNDADAEQKLENLYERGYAGAFSWSLLPEKNYDKIKIDKNALFRFENSSILIKPDQR